MTALDLQTGALKWRANISAINTVQNFQPTDDGVIHFTDNTTFHGINASTGDLLFTMEFDWMIDFDDRMSVDEDFIYMNKGFVCSTSDQVFPIRPCNALKAISNFNVYSRKDLSLLWSFDTQVANSSQISVSDAQASNNSCLGLQVEKSTGVFDGSSVWLWECREASADVDWSHQAWRFDESSGTLRPFLDEGLCVGVASRTAQLGAGLELQTCDAGWYQHWTMENGRFRIADAQPLCMDVPGAYYDNGNVLWLWTCTEDDAAQQWEVAPMHNSKFMPSSLV